MNSCRCVLACLAAAAAASQIAPPSGLYQTPSIGGSGSGQHGSGTGTGCGGPGASACGGSTGTVSLTGGSGCGGPGEPGCGGNQPGAGDCGGPGQPGCGGFSGGSTSVNQVSVGGISNEYVPPLGEQPSVSTFITQPVNEAPAVVGCGGPGEPGCGGSQPVISGCGGPGQPGCGGSSSTFSVGGGCGGPGQPGCGGSSSTILVGGGCGGPGQPGCGGSSSTISVGGGCGGPGQPGCGGSSSTILVGGGCGGPGQPGCGGSSSTTLVSGGCGGPGQPGCGGSSSTVSVGGGCGGPGQPGCGGSPGGSSSVTQVSVGGISNDYIPPRREQASGSSFVSQSASGRPAVLVGGGAVGGQQAPAFNRRPSNDFLDNPGKYSNQKFSNPPVSSGGGFGAAGKQDYSSNVFLGSPSLSQTVKRPGFQGGSVSTQTVRRPGFQGDSVSTQTVRRPGFQSGSVSTQTVRRPAFQGGSVSTQTVVSQGGGSGGRPGFGTTFVSTGTSNGIVPSSGTRFVSSGPSAAVPSGQNFRPQQSSGNNYGGQRVSGQPAGAPGRFTGVGSGFQSQIQRVNANPGGGNSGPIGHQLGTCSSSLVCVPEAMCNPYTGFVRGGLLFEPAEPSDLPTVALDRCNRLKDGGAGEGVCCQMPHINDPWPRDQ